MDFLVSKKELNFFFPTVFSRAARANRRHLQGRRSTNAYSPVENNQQETRRRQAHLSPRNTDYEKETKCTLNRLLKQSLLRAALSLFTAPSARLVSFHKAFSFQKKKTALKNTSPTHAEHQFESDIGFFQTGQKQFADLTTPTSSHEREQHESRHLGTADISTNSSTPGNCLRPLHIICRQQTRHSPFFRRYDGGVVAVLA